MGDSLDSNSPKDEDLEKESKVFLNSKITEIHPLAFTIEFDDQKFDESKKSKVQERLSALTLRHRRNPSLPDFREFKNGKNTQAEKLVSPVNPQHVPLIHKRIEKFGKPAEIQWKSSALKAAKNFDFKTPVSFKPNLAMKDDLMKNLKANRRYSLDAVDDDKNTFQKINDNNSDNNYDEGAEGKKDDTEMKSDTVSEAGTYTVDKDDEALGEGDRTTVLQVNNDRKGGEFVNGLKDSNHSSWIKDWVRDVEKQNKLNPAPREPPAIFSRHLENGSSAGGACKIPSPINTLTRKAKPRSTKPGQDAGKLNGSTFHRRSSSLSAKSFAGRIFASLLKSAPSEFYPFLPSSLNDVPLSSGQKDCGENLGSESSLETESFLKTTESVMASLRNKMRLSLERRSPDLRGLEKRNFNYKERPHPPSTASDTSSETEGKLFKKPIGSPFTSARLNRAFSLRRAKADPEKDSAKAKLSVDNEGGNAKQDGISKASKPPSSAPFSRLDCGRFSMRSTTSNVRPNWSAVNQAQKKETKKSNGGNRSTSSLSSREVEFQNWRRRKSFDPMKSAAEGRKKELAKKAAMNNTMTQSVNLGSGPRARSAGGNPVLRSASFHSTAQVLENEEGDAEEFQEQGSTDEQEESASSHFSNYYSLSSPHNGPSQRGVSTTPVITTPMFSSRSSLVSETHSSPSRRLRSNDLENLVMTAISEASFKLKSRSCKLLKKLNYLYDPNDEKSLRLRNEIAVLESGQNSSRNSPVHKATSRDLSAVLKNLKGVENVFNVLEEVLFSENLEVYIKE